MTGAGSGGTIALTGALAVPLLLSLVVAVAAAASGATSPVQQAVTACGSGPVSAGRAGNVTNLDASQLGNAQVIYDVSASMGLPQRAAVIAEATAMQESRLVNLPGGTSDSLGLFQQRPSQGWGPAAEVMQPAYAATQFYDSLVRVPGWQTLPLTVAAQDVQHSSHPDAYAQWETLGDALAATFSGQANDCLTDEDTGGGAGSRATRLPKGFTLPAGTSPPAAAAIAFAVAQLGKPYIYGGTGPAGYDCSGLVMMAYLAAGIDLPRTTYEQVYAGTPIYSVGALQPGDLLFTPGSDGTPEQPGHVGIYIGTYHGQGLVIEAPHTGESIEITPLAGYWAQQTVAIRRVA